MFLELTEPDTAIDRQIRIAVLRSVAVGRRNGSHAELDEGASVVLHPSDTLEDGSRVARRSS